MTQQQRLRDLIASPEILVAPGVFDAFGAMMAAHAGFAAIYLSGASIAYTKIARPDIGFAGLAEVSEITANIRDRVDLPLIVDADTGFGNALNVQRTVRVLERSGATAIQIEDQASPKRCGHLDGKTLISTTEMIGKIKAATDARHDEKTMIIARTDAIAVEGFETALTRAAAYAEAGADLLFIEAISDEDQIAKSAKLLGKRVPLMVNMVEGGKTPLKSADELQQLGFSLVIFPGGLVRAMARTAQDYFASLKTAGTTQPFLDRMLNFNELNELIGTPDMLATGRKYDKGA
ncbi:MAG: isocitrate lyase/phosphoenolpyruvate mutase family protein [Fimbriimonadaceae bacterium]|nr:isocitrate lyase/phosphoenolpyruvate mutase family protein [Alphaproteobacteria bacterium]